jgi:C_GCAxxG_C_C family probable redox protein
MAEMRITQFPEQFKKIAQELSSVYGPTYHGCAQIVTGTFMEILGISDELVLMAASCFAGGTKRGLMCGAISGGLIVLGIKYGRRNLEDGIEAEEESLEPAMELVDRFMGAYNTTSCSELTGFDLGDPDQFQSFVNSAEANQKCTERVSRVCGWVAEIISKRDNRLDI